VSAAGPAHRSAKHRILLLLRRIDLHLRKARSANAICAAGPCVA